MFNEINKKVVSCVMIVLINTVMILDVEREAVSQILYR